MRYAIAIGLVLALLGGLGAVKFAQISSLMKMGAEMEKAGAPPETVSSAPAREEKWDGTFTSVGSVTAGKGVSISTEVPGVVAAIRFDSGGTVKQGDVLVELDSRVERAQLASIVARRDLASLTAERTKTLVEKQAVPAAQLDTDEAQLKAAKADLGALEAQIARKTVRAPFAGKLGIRAVNVGQYLGPGTVITVLESKDALYVDFSVPQQRAAEVKVGTKISVALSGAAVAATGDGGAAVTAANGGGVFAGTVAAIEPNVDAVTRSMKLRATIADAQDKLRPGMFANVTITLAEQAKPVVVVPQTAVVHASYGDSVFVVEDKKEGPPGTKIARQQIVKLGESRGDFVALLEGVKLGQEVVTAGAFKLRNNAGVVINNDVKLDPKLNPALENH